MLIDDIQTFLVNSGLPHESAKCEKSPSTVKPRSSRYDTNLGTSSTYACMYVCMYVCLYACIACNEGFII